MKFLGRARKFFQDLGSEPVSHVQHFNVLCASGHRVRGERTEGYQALRCPACGDGVFVLPRSPLPDPIAPPRAAKPRQARREEPRVEEGPVELSDPAIAAVDLGGSELKAADAEIIWDDEPADKADRGGAGTVLVAAKLKVDDEERRGPSSVEKGRGSTARATESDPSGRRRAKAKPPSPIPAPPVERPARTRDTAVAEPVARGQSRDKPSAAVVELAREPRKRTRYSLIFWAVPVLVVATIGFRYWQQKRREYPLIAERGRIEGIPALDDGKFDRAYQLLSAAKSAVDALGGDVEDADRIRSAADEAAIFIDLSSQTVEEMLEDAGRTDPDIWASRFDNLYKNRSIIIDSWITRAPEPGQGNYDIDYKVFPAGGASRFGDSDNVRPERIGLIDLTGFQLLEVSRPRLGDRVTFGARLASFQYDSARDFWVIRLEPGSGVFIQHAKALEKLGWPSETAINRNPEGQP